VQISKDIFALILVKSLTNVIYVTKNTQRVSTSKPINVPMW